MTITEWLRSSARGRLTVVAFFLSISAVAGEAVAQDTIVTDRPDFTESPASIPQGSVQIEGGFLWTDSGPVQTFLMPDALVRVGFRRGIEIRVGVPNYEDREFISGLGDISLGAKVEIRDLIESWQTAGVVTLILPTGKDGISGDGVGLAGLLAGSTDLADGWTLGAQASVGFIPSGGDTLFELGGTVVTGTSISDELGAFFELGTVIPERGGFQLVLHSGLTYLVQDNLQLDLHAGFGLTDTSIDALFGTGISVIL